MLGPFQLYGLIGAPSRRLPRRRMRAPPLTFVWYPIEILSLFSNYAEDIRHLFRVLAILLWSLGALLTTFIF